MTKPELLKALQLLEFQDPDTRRESLIFYLLAYIDDDDIKTLATEVLR